MRPQQADQAFGQLRQIIVELFTQSPHEEGKAFEQTLHIRVLRPWFIQVQLRGPIRERLCELLAGLAQVTHLRVEITQRQIFRVHK
ncbi:hypothetical protein D3C85_1707560 [compost metagenome]